MSAATGTTVRPWRRGAISSPGRIAPYGGTGYDKPEPPPKDPEPRLWPAPPPVKFCIRRGEECEDDFPASEDSECCAWCRDDLLEEADLNGLDVNLPERQLIDTLASINEIEGRVILHLFACDRERERGAVDAASLQRQRATLRMREKAAIIAKAAA